MSSRKITDEQIAEACELREKGWSCGRIALRFKSRGVDISEGAISWHCLVNGADIPPERRRSATTPPGTVARRNGHTVRTFDEREDELLLALEARGERISNIARALNRRPNSVRARLATLARREERAAEAA